VQEWGAVLRAAFLRQYSVESEDYPFLGFLMALTTGRIRALPGRGLIQDGIAFRYPMRTGPNNPLYFSQAIKIN